MNPTYFTISDFCISDAAIPKEIADKIYNNHLLILDEVRSRYEGPVMISKNSGYRPYRWERNKGRSGDSEHVFRGMGAVDVTANNLSELLNCLIHYSPYRRICLYKDHSFIHCDYAADEGKRYYYEAGNDKQWVFVREIETDYD